MRRNSRRGAFVEDQDAEPARRSASESIDGVAFRAGSNIALQRLALGHVGLVGKKFADEPPEVPQEAFIAALKMDDD